MSRAIRYVECTHCGETVGTCYVTCPYCGYRLAVHSLPPRENVRIDTSHHRLKGITTTRYLVGDQQLRYAIHSAISAMDISKQDKNYIIDSTIKVSDEVLELLASSKTTESEQTENPKQDAGREIDTSAYPFIQLEADELVRMICDAYQTGVFSGKEQS